MDYLKREREREEEEKTRNGSKCYNIHIRTILWTSINLLILILVKC